MTEAGRLFVAVLSFMIGCLWPILYTRMEKYRTRQTTHS